MFAVVSLEDENGDRDRWVMEWPLRRSNVDKPRLVAGPYKTFKEAGSALLRWEARRERQLALIACRCQYQRGSDGPADDCPVHGDPRLADAWTDTAPYYQDVVSSRLGAVPCAICNETQLCERHEVQPDEWIDVCEGCLDLTEGLTK